MLPGGVRELPYAVSYDTGDLRTDRFCKSLFGSKKASRHILTKHLEVLNMNTFIVLLLIQEGHVVSSLEENYNLPKNPYTKEEEIVGRLSHILAKKFLERLNEQPVEFKQVQNPCDSQEG